MDKFDQEFIELVHQKGVNWKIKGLLAANDKIFPFGSDTKVLSTIFELFCSPLIREISSRYGLKVIDADQTIYPDFTLFRDQSDRNKIAIDVKTTYRRCKKKDGTERNFVYTLGSYTSYIRNNTKNITFPFDHYDKHWVIGFLYSRTPDYYNDTRIYNLEERNEIHTPYTQVEFFVQEKYKIAGEKPGSGNTTNIASFPCNNIGPLMRGEGPFSEYGEEFFLDYWRNYGRRANDRDYTTINGFLKLKELKD